MSGAFTTTTFMPVKIPRQHEVTHLKKKTHLYTWQILRKCLHRHTFVNCCLSGSTCHHHKRLDMAHIPRTCGGRPCLHSSMVGARGFPLGKPMSKEDHLMMKVASSRSVYRPLYVCCNHQVSTPHRAPHLSRNRTNLYSWGVLQQWVLRNSRTH